MDTRHQPDTDQLLQRARGGDASARDGLLARHRPRLRRMVRLHLDPRLGARVDPSDVVQETLAEAARRLDDYLRRPPLPFYPWLRQIALDRLVDLRRRHLRARKRSVAREEPGVLSLPDESAAELAARLIDLGSSPSRHLLREELRERVRAALGRLPAADREVLVLRHLEQMPAREVAAVLGVGEGAVRMRLVRALGRLRDLLDQDLGEEAP
jgi:RNA polymerase sigma-70 factor (ECF subfamily)